MDKLIEEVKDKIATQYSYQNWEEYIIFKDWRVDEIIVQELMEQMYKIGYNDGRYEQADDI